MSIWLCHCGAHLAVSCSSEHEHSKCIMYQPLPRFIEEAEGPLRAEIERLERCLSLADKEIHDLECDLASANVELRLARDEPGRW